MTEYYHREYYPLQENMKRLESFFSGDSIELLNHLEKELIKQSKETSAFIIFKSVLFNDDEVLFDPYSVMYLQDDHYIFRTNTEHELVPDIFEFLLGEWKNGCVLYHFHNHPDNNFRPSNEDKKKEIFIRESFIITNGVITRV